MPPGPGQDTPVVGGLPLRVLIAVGHDDIAKALAAVVALSGSVLVGEARDGATALQLARGTAPDVVLLDMALPGTSGPDATRIICRDCPGTAVVALSARNDLASVESALAAGVQGYLLHDVANEELSPAIASVLAGRRYVSARILGGEALLQRS